KATASPQRRCIVSTFVELLHDRRSSVQEEITLLDRVLNNVQQQFCALRRRPESQRQTRRQPRRRRPLSLSPGTIKEALVHNTVPGRAYTYTMCCVARGGRSAGQ